MKRALLAATAFAIAVAGAPKPALAGQLWTDGNYYSACPEQIVSQSGNIEVLPQNGWTKDFVMSGSWLCKYTGSYVNTTTREMICTYEPQCGQLRAVQPFPAGYSTCRVYGGIWFICLK